MSARGFRDSDDLALMVFDGRDAYADLDGGSVFFYPDGFEFVNTFPARNAR